MEKTINAVGWGCPKPIIETKKVLDSMQEGTVITLVDNEAAMKNLMTFASGAGFTVTQSNAGNLYSVKIIKKAGQEACAVSQDNLVIAITSSQLGQGALELGESLMKGYIYALTEVSPRPKTLIFINSGVFFTTEDSPVEDSLRLLESDGVEIISCGTCLNFFGRTDKLIIGSISNMYQIVDKLNNATNTITI